MIMSTFVLNLLIFATVTAFAVSKREKEQRLHEYSEATQSLQNPLGSLQLKRSYKMQSNLINNNTFMIVSRNKLLVL